MSEDTCSTNASTSSNSSDELPLSECSKKIIKEYSKDALKAFIEGFGLENEEVTYDQFTDSYQGEFYSGGDFAKHCIDEFCEHPIDFWIVIDYDKTWEYNLHHDYTECNRHYFRDW